MKTSTQSQIVEKHQSILQTKKDLAIFFDALMNPPRPNTNLKKAVARYNESIKEK
ncbi:DUF1778 domain-containing protein [Sediminibacterium sp.]|uniref:type II toxin -antitoxin system TacA 1-like antitoxin n=1 Tax=Sediminibacterium sp. TaxID=1917865 RepID=UPI0025D23770|nr:DUF1778 domain-containing protein [Sediminibacterium sp.]MBT9485680.1 DUF1778 domain-containing protein [Sediminibacterium sp.]